MDYQIHKEGKYNYIDQGEGEVLLLLHGLFGALSNWKDVLNHFSGRYRVVIPLMPIFEMNILKLSVEGLANFIHDFIEHKSLMNWSYWLYDAQSFIRHVGWLVIWFIWLRSQTEIRLIISNSIASCCYYFSSLKLWCRYHLFIYECVTRRAS